MEAIIATPKEAATVILLRPAHGTDSGPFEVLMVHRHPNSAFVPECYVFPGGCIDAEDCGPEIIPHCRGRDRETAMRILGDMPTEEMALGAWVAGIRETFEETGILLAHTAAEKQELDRRRRRLLAGESTFLQLVREESWLLAADRLEYFAHWITPEFLPLRYDVRFFIARAPEEQVACPDGVELTGHVWTTPLHALAEYDAQRFPMVLPTIMTLRELADHESIASVFAAARRKRIPAILTKVETRDNRLVEIMPDGTTFSFVK
ncbi:MAG: hypothetical protein QM278_03805 [Pseudomonadota bacterium]|nr:hypothetical protein [Pseudomonadota bacterium]